MNTTLTNPILTFSNIVNSMSTSSMDMLLCVMNKMIPLFVTFDK